MSLDNTHRKSPVALELKYADGKPLANKPVEIKQVRHEFLFGTTAFETLELIGGNADGSDLSADRKNFLQERIDKILALNNFITLPFYLGRYEPEEGKSDQDRTIAAAKWLQEQGATVKGHPLCWHTVWPTWLMKYSNNDIKRKMLARIEREVSAYKGVIDMWDVINEVVIMPIFDKYDNAITRVCKELGRVSMIREVFDAAVEANPRGIFLLNDFDISTKYEILIDGCLQAGIPIDVIGIQSHQHQGYWGKDKLYEVLERFSHFGLPIHFTENTLLSGDIMPAHIVDLNDWQVDEWPSTPEGEERQTREVVEMYEILFADPHVEAITAWGLTDGGWLNAPVGLLREDNTAKPAYETLLSKVKGEWWTSSTVVSDDKGEVQLNGFRGDYYVSCADLSSAFSLDGKNSKLTITLENI